jgi:23S rRNA (cytidine2498-2'-O)-methyltransferase
VEVIYVVEPQYRDDLLTELSDVSRVEGNLVWAPLQKNVCFAADIWFNPTIVTFESISEATRILRQAGKYWFLNPLEQVRRSRLIEAGLFKLPSLIQTFPVTTALPNIGCFSLLDRTTLLFATNRMKNPPLGRYEFVEDKENPPNRAYLKLFEAITLLGRTPQRNETVIDLGASPGGWTYVMQSFGTHVTAIDKAPLDERIAKLPGVTTKLLSAFAFEPEKLSKPVDWLLCDVACYPDRLYTLLLRWFKTNMAKQMIITIKLQGKTDHASLNKFKAIPNSTVLHLTHNKHEVTFFYPALSLPWDVLANGPKPL